LPYNENNSRFYYCTTAPITFSAEISKVIF